MKTKTLLLAVTLLCANAPLFAKDDKPQPTPLLTQPADKLITVLKSDAGLKEKTDACRELAVVGGTRALPALIALLADEKLNHMARHALETMPGDGVNRALRGELPRLKGPQLTGVIGSLGVRRDAKAVRPLSRFLAASDPEVAQTAAWALGRIGSASAAKALRRALPKTTPANQLAFYDGWLHCAEVLAAAGKPKPAQAIYDHLRDAAHLPPQVRAGAVRGALLTRGAKGVTLLKACLASSDYPVFAAAVQTSMEMPGTDVTETLIAGLPGLRADNQMVILQALGQRGGAAVAISLAGLARGGEKPVRLAATRAIAETDQPAALPLLVELLGARDGEISRAAQDGLAALSGQKADAAALTLARSAVASERVAGIELIGRRRMTAAIPVLLAAAGDADAGVRSSALKRWGELAEPGDAPALIQSLHLMTRPGDLAAAGQVLGALCGRAQNPEAVCELLLAALGTAPPPQKAVLLGALGSAGVAKSLPAIRAAVDDPGAEVRAAAIQALADWPDLAVAPDLLKLARAPGNDDERALAFRGCVRLARESSGSPAEKMKLLAEAATVAGGVPDKMLLLAGAGDIFSTEAMKFAAAYLSDPALADEAGAAAVKIAAKLDAGQKAEIASALNEVLKSAKSLPVLDKARKRLDELGLKPE